MLKRLQENGAKVLLAVRRRNWLKSSIEAAESEMDAHLDTAVVGSQARVEGMYEYFGGKSADERDIAGWAKRRAETINGDVDA
eukprot:scaffold481744_cov51-Prasinocladus_malaysianus.AAC.1